MKINHVGMLGFSDKFAISIFSFISFFLFFSTQSFLYSVIFILCVAIHECSHIFFLRHYGTRILRVEIYPFGIDIHADTRHLSYKKEIVYTLAGSFSNIIFALAAFLFLRFIPSAPLLFFMLCNAFLGFFNLIPLSFFDGGRAIRLMLYDIFDIDKAFYLHKALDFLSALILFFYAVFIVAGSGYNFSVCAVIIYAAVCVLTRSLRAGFGSGSL